MPKYNSLIEKTVQASDLSKSEKEEIKKELESHFFEAERYLNLKGKDEKEAINNFGDPKLIGKQIRQVHRRFEWIPILGDLIYYPPFRYGIVLSLKITVYFLISFVLFLYSGDIFSLGEKIGFSNSINNLINIVFVLFFPAFVAIISAYDTFRQTKKLKDIFHIIFVSFLPYLFIESIMVVPQRIIYGLNYDDFDNIFFLGYFLIIFYVIYLIAFLAIKFIKKYLYVKKK